MKTKIIVWILIIVVFIACNSQRINLVTGVDRTHIWDQTTLIKFDTLMCLPDSQKLEYISLRLSQIVPAICMQSDAYGIKNIDSITFTFGSGEARVNDVNGAKFDGFFEKELIVNVFSSTQNISFFARSFNKVEELPEDLSYIGKSDLFFEIEAKKGLCHYVDYKTSIWLAKNFDLPLYKGKITKENKASIEDAYASAEGILVVVHPGDKFFLGSDKKYIRNGELY